MQRTSLYFLIIAVVAFFAADISISTLDPWLELKKMGLGMLTPDFFSLPGFGQALFNTISFALYPLHSRDFLGLHIHADRRTQ